MRLTARRVNRALLILAAAMLLYVARIGLGHDVKTFCDQVFNRIPPPNITPVQLVEV
jgi:hypothetical protein